MSGEDSLRIVVGEDQPLTRKGVVAVLEDAGFEVVAVAGDTPDPLRLTPPEGDHSCHPRPRSLTERETQQVERANQSGRTPVVFIHGLWLLPSSWDNWAQLFEEAGYAAVAPSWPDDPETVEAARANPEVLAKKTLKQVADHTAHVIGKLDKKPAVMGHSTGGLLTFMIADRGLSAASVAIDPGPFRGVLPLPLSALKSAAPALKNPLNRGRAITLSLDEFKYGWANALSDEEAEQLYERYHVAAPGSALMQMANANLNPFTEAKVDPKNPDRGPLLIIDGEKDHTVPWAIANAAYKGRSTTRP